MNKSVQVRSAVMVGLVVVSSTALAEGPTTLSGLATAVNFDAVGLAILSIAAAIIPVYVIWKGSKFVLSAIKGA